MTFNQTPQSISLKMNMIVQLEFKLAYYNIAVQYIIHNAIVTLSAIRYTHKDVSKIAHWYRSLFSIG